MLLAKRKRKHITLSQFVDVSRKIGEQSLISRTEKSTNWDFERASEYLHKQGLEQHIYFVSAKRRDKTLPLNSERHIYELQNIMVRDLDVELDNSSVLNASQDCVPISHAKWHFEGCQFRCMSSSMWIFAFPWRGAFRFYNNEFCFPSTDLSGDWALVFKSGSRVWFVGNDFGSSSIQIQTQRIDLDSGKTDPEEISSDEAWRKLGHFGFIANKRVGDLWIQEGPASIEISGMNRIDRLSVDLIVDMEEDKRTSVYFGPRERIDPLFHNCLKHRSLFLTMRRLAAIGDDSRQLTIFDRQLERIEYFLNKEREKPSLLDFRVWVEYWQDRILYAWRRWSSDFYRSWLRPLSMLAGGYLLINAVPPALVVESFSTSHWIDFTLRPMTEIAAYELSLDRILGTDYETATPSGKMFLKAMGLIEVIWIGVWGFAFMKSIKR